MEMPVEHIFITYLVIQLLSYVQLAKLWRGNVYCPMLLDCAGEPVICACAKVVAHFGRKITL